MSDIEATISEMEIDGDPILAYYAGRIRESLRQVPEGEPVAWTIVGPDGKSSIGGWSDISSHRVMSEIGILRDGHRYAYAYEANPAPTTSGECRHDFRKGTVANCIHCGWSGYADPSTPLATPAQAAAELPGGEFSDWFEDWASQNQVNQVRAPNGTLLDPESARVEQAYLSACMTSAIHYMELCRQEACQATPTAGKCPKNCGCVVHCRREQLAVAALPEDIEEAISALRICRDHIQNYCPAGGLGSNKATSIRIADSAIARLARRGGS